MSRRTRPSTATRRDARRPRRCLRPPPGPRAEAPTRPRRTRTRAGALTTGMDSARHRIVVVSPVRDEEATLERTLRCMESQTLAPLRWVVVDDGSTDRTPEILAQAQARIPWLRVVKRTNRGYRKVGGGVIDAFCD